MSGSIGVRAAERGLVNRVLALGLGLSHGAADAVGRSAGAWGLALGGKTVMFLSSGPCA